MSIALVADIHIDTSEDFNFERNRIIELAEAIVDSGANEVWLIGDILNKCKPSHYDIIVLSLLLDNLQPLKISYLDGNHERVREGEYILDGIMGMFKVTKLPNEFRLGSLKVTAIGHSELYKLVDVESSDLLLSHFRWSHPLYGKGEIGYENILRNKFNNIILGDIHNFYKPHDNVEYISQPYSSKYQTTQENGFILISVKGGKLVQHRIITNLPTKVKLTVPLSKLVHTLETLDHSNKYVIDVLINDQKLLKSFNKIEIPRCVTRLRPKVTNEEPVSTTSVIKSENSILETILTILPNTIKQEKEYIKEILEKQ